MFGFHGSHGSLFGDPVSVSASNPAKAILLYIFLQQNFKGKRLLIPRSVLLSHLAINVNYLLILVGPP